MPRTMSKKSSFLLRILVPFADVPRWLIVALGIFIWILVALGWVYLTYGGVIPPLFLPPPGAVMGKAGDMIVDGSLYKNTLSSVQVVLYGFIISSIVAVPLGLWMGTYRVVQGLIEPLVNFIRYLPVTSFVPLFILWIGIGLEERIAVIFFGTFFQQLVMISTAANSVSRDLVNASYTLGTKRHEVVWHVIFPAALPAILDTLRVTMGWAWTYLVVAEMVAASSGLGYMSMKAMRGFQVDTIFLAILTIGALGMLMDQAFRFLHLKLAPWA